MINNKPSAPTNISQQRALNALRTARCRGITRKDLDAACGVSNSPDLVNKLRARGFEITTTREKTHNRFGDEVLMGVYRLVGGATND